METVEVITKKLLAHLDSEPGRADLLDTPARYQRFLQEFLDPKPLKMTTFDAGGYDEMVIQTDIPFYSICEHHLLPFFGHGAIGYIPGKRIVGLSKLSRSLDFFSRKLQNQERITVEVADFIAGTIEPKGVGVVLSARHLCMEMRGIKQPHTTSSTSCLKGVFKTSAATRHEFLNFC